MNKIILTSFWVMLCLSADYVVRGLWTLHTEKADWISTVVSTCGNVAGGVIGGFVALMVAKYQIDNQKKSGIHSELMEYKGLFMTFIDDLQFVSTTLDSITKSGKLDGDLLKNHISVSSWEVLKTRSARHLTPDCYLKCNKMVRRIQLIPLLVQSNELTMSELTTLKADCDSLVSTLQGSEPNGVYSIGFSSDINSLRDF